MGNCSFGSLGSLVWATAVPVAMIAMPINKTNIKNADRFGFLVEITWEIFFMFFLTYSFFNVIRATNWEIFCMQLKVFIARETPNAIDC